MANPEHLKMLKKGVKAWNTWRKKNVNETVDLTGANLTNAILFDVDLRYANLTGAKLNCIVLKGADLRHACIKQADFYCADLRCVKLNFAAVQQTDLKNVDFRGATLRQASLARTNLGGANLTGANLSHAHLWFVNLGATNLNMANFTSAHLDNVDFSYALLKNTILKKAKIGKALFNNVDLSEVTGLETVFHSSPSFVGVDTLYKSQGKIPDEFLRNAGVPEEIVDVVRSIRAGPAIQWHSCFISYSNKDEEFAGRLHSRMREANMRVWFAPEDLKGGEKLHEQLFEAIQIQDRLLIVLSEHSIQSEWVMTEIRKAREVEKKEKRRKLFPIRLTDFETLRDWTCFDADTGKDLAVEVREYFIPDFSNWKVLADGHPAAFESAFARLKKDLEAENSKKS